MAKRTRKPTVKPEVSRQWLRRFEEDGDSPPRIAKADGYDVRTVRKQIDVARQERERREARSMVLRHALEKHYADLVDFAGKLDRALTISSSAIALAERQDRMWSALREHLPRSAIWAGIGRWEHLQQEMMRLREEGMARLLGELESKPSFKVASGLHDAGFRLSGLRDAADHRLSNLAAQSPLPLEKFHTGAVQEGVVDIHYGGWHCATVPPEQESEVKELIASLITRVDGLPECKSLGEMSLELRRVTEKLREDLAAIILRRVVPGRCRYCPI